MTQKTTYKRAKSKFNMADTTAKIRKRFRRRLKKTISKSKVREVWKDWVDIMIIEPLIEKGKVQVDKKFTIEIVGRRLVDDKRKLRLRTEGKIAIKGIGIRDAVKLNQLRKEFTYRIVAKDSRFKEGVLMYDASPRVKKAVYNSLCNTNKYYRIENVNK